MQQFVGDQNAMLSMQENMQISNSTLSFQQRNDNQTQLMK